MHDIILFTPVHKYVSNKIIIKYWYRMDDNTDQDRFVLLALFF